MSGSEPRRSVRSTKGQNSRLSEINAEATSPVPKAPPRKRKSHSQPEKSASPATEVEEDGDKKDDIIRCVCGADKEDDDDNRMMIQCETCTAWQHTTCMGIPRKKIPTHYFCEQCKPENHRVLLEKMDAGERPWEKPARGGRKAAAKKGGRRKSTPADTESKGEQTPVDSGLPPPPATVPTCHSGEISPTTIAPAPSAANGHIIPSTQGPAFKSEEDDAMDIDGPEISAGAPVHSQPAQELGNGTVDRDATISATDGSDGMPPPATMKVERSQSPGVRPEPQTPAQNSKGRRDSRAKSESTKKRKASVDGEYQAEEKPPHPDKKHQHRRMSSAHSIEQGDRASVKPPKTPTETRKRSSISSVKQPPTPEQKSRSAEELKPQPELVNKITDIRHGKRLNAARMVYGVLRDRAAMLGIPGLQAQLKDRTAEELVESLTIQIEYHCYHTLVKNEVFNDYSKRTLAIYRNMKSNTALADEILFERMEPKRLATMKTEEMAAANIQEQNALYRQESEKQHTLLNTDTGPRIRRTHKGEEMVDDPTAQSGQDTILSSGNVVRRNAELPEYTPGSEDKSPSIGPAPESPQTVGAASEPPRSPSLPASRPPPIDTSGTTKVHPEKTARSFSIENIWSHVESPDAARPPRAAQPTQTPVSAKPVDNAFDKDVDMLLNDEDKSGAGTPPYSPASFDDHYSPRADDDVPDNWRGRIEMNSICNMPATAEFLGGAQTINNTAWHALLDPVLDVDGRIKYDRVTEYLCGQKYSRSAIMAIASVKPADPAHQVEFDRLFDYFRKKERYAVVGKHTQQLVKDVYLAPIEAQGTLPDWFNSVDHQVPVTGRSGRMLVLILVANGSRAPGSTPTPAMGQFPTPTPPLQFSPAPVPQQPYGTPLQQRHAVYGTPAAPSASPFPLVGEHSPQAPQPQAPPPQPQPQQQPQQRKSHSPPVPAPPVSAPPAAPDPPPPSSSLSSSTPQYQPQHELTKQLMEGMPGVTLLQARAVDSWLELHKDVLVTNPERIAELPLPSFLAQMGVEKPT